MIRRMWFRYLGPVLLLSLMINLSKFFEIVVVKSEEGNYTYEVTPLRTNRTYSVGTMWIRDNS